MKLKTVLTLAAAATLPHMVNAAPIETVEFIGAVTAQTCDVGVIVDGEFATSGQINLGTIAPGTSSSDSGGGAESLGEQVGFKIRLLAPGTMGDCDLDGVTAVDTLWTANEMSAAGIENGPHGTATGAFVKLALNESVKTEINLSNLTHMGITKAEAADGIDYTAQLVSRIDGGVGIFRTSATYSVIFN